MHLAKIKLLKGFWCENKGVTAVEFAFVGPIFFAIIFFTLEISLYMYKSSLLNLAMHEAMRKVQTAEVFDAVAPDTPETVFQKQICESLGSLMNCNMVSYDVRHFTSPGDVNLPDAIFDQNGAPQNFIFDAGQADEITTVRLSTPYRFSVKFIQDIFSPDGSPTITTAFGMVRNEPA